MEMEKRPPLVLDYGQVTNIFLLRRVSRTHVETLWVQPGPDCIRYIDTSVGETYWLSNIESVIWLSNLHLSTHLRIHRLQEEQNQEGWSLKFQDGSRITYLWGITLIYVWSHLVSKGEVK